ncbi:SusD/RagB family nutrient-binding outer membrane lipoprotein [Flavobacterium psychrophilum]|nr:SusD/RagB family nutrient-binding outer membrane lipoprotein [Flavobacterium psychrophilum]
MKNKIYVLLFALSPVIFSSCTDYLDVNESTNSAHTERVEPPGFLAAALATTFRSQAVSMNEYGSVMTNAWGGNASYYTNPYQTEFRGDLKTTTRQAIWNDIYVGVANFQNMINFPSNGEYDNHVAIAKIMKTYYLAYLVDLYGNIPYSKAFLGATVNATPSFDKDTEVYKGLFKNLDEANLLFANANAKAVGPEDIVFKGDMDKWAAFANTIRLRMCLRMSEVTDPAMVSLRTANLAIAASRPFVSADVTINPGYNNSTEAQYNPFALNFSRIVSGNIVKENVYSSRLPCASGYVAKVLNGTVNQPGVIVSSVVDPRRSRMFRATTIIGIDQGTGFAPTSTNPSLLGSGVTGFNSTIASDNESKFKNATSRDGFIMTLAESLFLQAEAAQRGYISGNPQTLFNSAIAASFNFYQKPYGNYTPLAIVPNAAAYTTSVDGMLGLGWTGTANKLQVILTQKWLALFGIHGIEPFLDKVRTGFPNNPLATGANASVHSTSPRRLLYPSTEYSANGANTPVVSLEDLFSVNAYTPFWVRN